MGLLAIELEPNGYSRGVTSTFPHDGSLRWGGINESNAWVVVDGVCPPMAPLAPGIDPHSARIMDAKQAPLAKKDELSQLMRRA